MIDVNEKGAARGNASAPLEIALERDSYAKDAAAHQSESASEARDIRIAMLLDASAEFADMASSFAASAREAARRGWIKGARTHAEQARSCMIELMATTREAVELAGGANV